MTNDGNNGGANVHGNSTDAQTRVVHTSLSQQLDLDAKMFDLLAGLEADIHFPGHRLTGRMG